MKLSYLKGLIRSNNFIMSVNKRTLLWVVFLVHLCSLSNILDGGHYFPGGLIQSSCPRMRDDLKTWTEIHSFRLDMVTLSFYWSINPFLLILLLNEAFFQQKKPMCEFQLEDINFLVQYKEIFHSFCSINVSNSF